jgi:hypothetical protein
MRKNKQACVWQHEVDGQVTQKRKPKSQSTRSVRHTLHRSRTKHNKFGVRPYGGARNTNNSPGNSALEAKHYASLTRYKGPSVGSGQKRKQGTKERKEERREREREEGRGEEKIKGEKIKLRKVRYQKTVVPLRWAGGPTYRGN